MDARSLRPPERPVPPLRAWLASPWLWALVTAAALLAAYVHTVNEAIVRGGLQQQAQRAADRLHAAAARRDAAVPDAGNAPAERVASVGQP